MHHFDSTDFWSWIGMIVIITTAASGIASIAAMLIGIRQWVAKRGAEKDNERQEQLRKINARLDELTEMFRQKHQKS